ncbi:MAG: flagellar hook basal-body protein [Planctomycetes bacterium]|nr:flagellar hook basal-body protein [Planctomycetota bacterium]
MIYGTRTSALGAMAQEAKLSLLANNIANSSTNGFKGDRLAFRERLVEALENNSRYGYYNGMVHKNGGAPFIENVVTDFEQGSLKQTGNILDFSISGDGFFVVQDLKSKQRFMTRNGGFKVDPLGNLVTQDGAAAVLNADLSPVRFEIDQPLNVSAARNGILYQNGLEISSLAVIVPQNIDMLEKVGNNLFGFEGLQFSGAQNSEINQGSIEMSTVNSFTEMSEMIQTVRNVEMNLRMVTLQDASVDRLVNGVGRA